MPQQPQMRPMMAPMQGMPMAGQPMPQQMPPPQAAPNANIQLDPFGA